MKAPVQNTRHGQLPAKLQHVNQTCHAWHTLQSYNSWWLEASVQTNLDMALQPARLHMLYETLEFILKNSEEKYIFEKIFYFFRKQMRNFWNIFEKFLKIKQKENYLIWATRWTVSCPNSNNPRQRRQKLGARNCDLRQRRQKLCTHVLINCFSFTTSIQLTSKCTGSSK